VTRREEQPADALRVSYEIQREATDLGFNWPDISGVLAKAHEEIEEIQGAVAEGNQEQARRELGDLLFAAVNMALFLHADPAHELRRANDRFNDRFAMLQEEVNGRGKPMADFTLDELDVIWEQVKRRVHS
jgi:uncharacterized protein YabN with tetrapyrrole methylase and pyrophosphatase domain